MFEVFEAGPGLDMVYRVLGAKGFIDQLDYGKVFDNEALWSVSQFEPGDMAIEVEWRIMRETLFRRPAANSFRCRCVLPNTSR